MRIVLHSIVVLQHDVQRGLGLHASVRRGTRRFERSSGGKVWQERIILNIFRPAFLLPFSLEGKGSGSSDACVRRHSPSVARTRIGRREPNRDGWPIRAGPCNGLNGRRPSGGAHSWWCSSHPARCVHSVCGGGGGPPAHPCRCPSYNKQGVVCEAKIPRLPFPPRWAGAQ